MAAVPKLDASAPSFDSHRAASFRLCNALRRAESAYYALRKTSAMFVTERLNHQQARMSSFRESHPPEAFLFASESLQAPDRPLDTAAMVAGIALIGLIIFLLWT